MKKAPFPLMLGMLCMFLTQAPQAANAAPLSTRTKIIGALAGTSLAGSLGAEIYRQVAQYKLRKLREEGARQAQLKKISTSARMRNWLAGIGVALGVGSAGSYWRDSRNKQIIQPTVQPEAEEFALHKLVAPNVPDNIKYADLSEEDIALYKRTYYLFGKQLTSKEREVLKKTEALTGASRKEKQNLIFNSSLDELSTYLNAEFRQDGVLAELEKNNPSLNVKRAEKIAGIIKSNVAKHLNGDDLYVGELYYICTKTLAGLNREQIPSIFKIAARIRFEMDAQDWRNMSEEENKALYWKVRKELSLEERKRLCDTEETLRKSRNLPLEAIGSYRRYSDPDNPDTQWDDTSVTIGTDEIDAEKAEVARLLAQ